MFEQDALVLDPLPEAIQAALENHNRLLANTQEDPDVLQSVVETLLRWDAGDVITVAFRGGTADLHRKIAQAASEWTKHANLRFDFGEQAGAFRKWSPSDTQYAADIRIGFDTVFQPGYWSVVGRNSVQPAVVGPGAASMNFGGFDTRLPAEFAATVMHEFGHAIGFQHEHAHPTGGCDNEFRWNDDPGYRRTVDANGQFIPDAAGRRPGIYTVLAGPPNRWSKAKVDHNLKQLPNSSAFQLGPFDRQSIMKYLVPRLDVHARDGERVLHGAQRGAVGRRHRGRAARVSAVGVRGPRRRAPGPRRAERRAAGGRRGPRRDAARASREAHRVMSTASPGFALGDDRLRFATGLVVSLVRTTRVPEDGREYPLTAHHGEFPLRAAAAHPHAVPGEWIDRQRDCRAGVRRRSVLRGVRGTRAACRASGGARQERAVRRTGRRAASRRAAELRRLSAAAVARRLLRRAAPRPAVHGGHRGRRGRGLRPDAQGVSAARGREAETAGGFDGCVSRSRVDGALRVGRWKGRRDGPANRYATRSASRAGIGTASWKCESISSTQFGLRA